MTQIPHSSSSATEDAVRMECWILIVGLLIVPVAPRIADLLFVAFLIGSAIRVKRSSWLDASGGFCWNSLAWLAGLLWFVVRTSDMRGLGLGTLIAPWRFPLNLLDYVPFILGLLILRARGFYHQEIEKIMWAICITGPFQLLLAIGQWKAGWDFNWRWPSHQLPILWLALHSPSRGRIEGGLRHPNGLGTYALVGTCAVAGLLTAELRRSQPRRLRILVLGMLLATHLTLLVGSGTRAAWLAFPLLAILFAVSVGIRLKWILIPLISVILVCGVAAFDIGPPTRLARIVVPDLVSRRLASIPDFKRRHFTFRVDVFVCMSELAAEKPWAGWGVGKATQECEQRLDEFVNHGHNLLLHWAAETGWPHAISISVLLLIEFWLGIGAIRRLPIGAPKDLMQATLLMQGSVWALSLVALPVFHTNRLLLTALLVVAIPSSIGWADRRQQAVSPAASLAD